MFVQREDDIIKETIEGMEKLLLCHFLWIKRPMQLLFSWPLQNESKQSRGRFLLILYFFVSSVYMYTQMAVWW
uniref:Uncharacterized protein n=1 Tax=Trichogramma kaykai TaxID=54128 RepID=A0ABD2WMR3_9HYME